MKPKRYEEVTAGYVAYNQYNAIVGIIMRMDEQSLQHTLKRFRRKNRASGEVDRKLDSDREGRI